MGIMDFMKAGVKEMMLARPDDKKNLVVWKWPDQNIPFLSQLTVDSDECAVFFKDGKCYGVLPGGQRHTLSTQNLPFLNDLVNQFTGGNLFIAEIYFVKTQPTRNIPVGGPIGDMIDPLTGEMVTPRMFGEFAAVVTDPAKFIISYVGQGTPPDDNEAIFDWVKQLFMLGVKTTLGELCEAEGKSLLQVVSLTQSLAQRFVQRCQSLEDIGVRVYQMGNFNLNFAPEEKKRLQEAVAEVAKAERQIKVKRAEAQANQFGLDQQFNQDARYVQQLAGNYGNYMAGQAMVAGAANPGGSGIAAMGAQMAAGVGVAQAMGAQMQYPQGPQYPALGMQPGTPQAWPAQAPQGGPGQPPGPPPMPMMAPPPPPFAAERVFVYANGIEQVSGLTSAAVAARVKAAPDAVHMVWAPGMPQWVRATDLPEIRTVLGI